MKWTLKKTYKIDCAHKLTLPYESKCLFLHGHSYSIILELTTNKLNKEGMVMDFHHLNLIAKPFLDKLDHGYLNQIFNFNPTAENIAKFIFTQLKKQLPKLSKVIVYETESGGCEYEE